MRFCSEIRNINTFSHLTASLASLGNLAWVRLSRTDVRFTVIPDQGSQVWAVLELDTIFNETFAIESMAEDNHINLEVPLQPLQRALKSAQNAEGASIRLTTKDRVPLLSLTIRTSSIAAGGFNSHDERNVENGNDFGNEEDGPSSSRYAIPPLGDTAGTGHLGRDERETVITQDIPVRVLRPASVQGLHEPVCREPDVHITLPSLAQLKVISDRFTKLAIGQGGTKKGFGGAGARLELSANMHGCLRLRSVDGEKGTGLDVSSTWTGLLNPELDPESVAGGAQGVENHPSTRMKRFGDAEGLSEEGWATVRVDGRDWGRVLGVGRLGGRVIACK